jgi:hypothetical protein
MLDLLKVEEILLVETRSLRTLLADAMVDEKGKMDQTWMNTTLCGAMDRVIPMNLKPF